MKTIIPLFVLVVILNTRVCGQSKSEVETITLNPHSDVRIVFDQLKTQKLKHGKYTYFHRNVKIIEGNFLAGKKHGKWLRFFQNGGVAIEAFYLQGKKHGNWSYYFTNGSKMASIYFNRGKKNGKWMSWHHDLSIFGELNYQNDSLIGAQKIYYSNNAVTMGAKIPQLQFSVDINYTDGKKLSNIEKYYSNGKLYEKYSKQGNVKDGIYTSFYDTGLPWRKMKYEDGGRLFSIYEYKNPVGKDAWRGTFRDGNGELISYKYSGVKYAKANYVNGLKDGKYIVYEQGSKELVTGYYNDNVKVGTWTYYKRKIAKKEVIKEYQYTGKDSAHAVFYASNFKERDAGDLIRLKKNATWRSYNSNNNLKSESDYVLNFNHGTSKGYRPDTQLDYTGGYYYGLKVGQWNYYNDFGKIIYKEKFVTQATADEGYLYSDSCRVLGLLENVFYSVSEFENQRSKRLAFIGLNEKHLNYNHFLGNGKSSSWGGQINWLNYDKTERKYILGYKLVFPQYIPWEILKRPNVVNDNDLGLFLETLNPRKLKVKGDKNSPKIGVAMVLLHIDEFGFVENTKIVRGIHPDWDKKILDLFTKYQYWEPAMYLNQPIAVAMQIKIPIDLQVVKKME